MTGTEYPLMHFDQQAHSGLAGHRQQPHPRRQCHLRRHRRDLGYQQRLLAPGDKADRRQPPGQIGWPVVVIELPFELLAPGRETGHLLGDHPVRVGFVQARPGDPRPAPVTTPTQRTT